MDDFEQQVVFTVGYVISAFIVFLSLGERLSKFSERIKFKPLSLLLLGLVGMCFLTLAINTPHKLVGPGYYFYKYAKLIFPVAGFFVMINIWTARDLPKLFSLLTAMACLTLPFLILQAFDYGSDSSQTSRFYSFFDDPNKYALFLNVVYGMTFPKLIGKAMRKQPFFLLFLVNIAVIILMFSTLSRSGIFTCFLITGISLWASRSWNIAKAAMLFLIPAFALFVLAFLIRYQTNSFNTALSDKGRVWTYLVGLNIISQRPFAGIGFANIVTVYEQYGSKYLFLLGRPLGIHNTALEIFAEEGVFGFIFYLLAVFVPIGMLAKKIYRTWGKYYPVAELAAMNIPIAFFCYGLFYVNYLADDYFWTYLAFTFIVLRAEIPKEFELNLIRPKLI